MNQNSHSRFKLNRRTVIRNLATLFSGSVLAQGMRVLALLFTARQLGAIQYGQYAACFALTSFSSILFSLGLNIWLLREGSRDLESTGALFGSVFAIKGVIGSMWLIFMLLLAPIIDSSSFPVELVRLSAVSVLLENLVVTLSVFYKSTLQNHITFILESGSNGIWLVATFLLMKSGEQQASVYILIRIVALLISFILVLWIIGRTIPLKVTISTTKWALRSALPFALSELLAWAAMRVDVLVIAFLIGEYATGLYSPAVGLVNALFLIPSAVYLVITPVLSNLFVTNVKQAWITARNSILLLVVIGLTMSIALLFTAGLLSSVLGGTFQEVREILRLLSPVLFIHSLTFGLAAILVATNQQAKRAIVQSIAVATNACLNLILVSWMGVRGAAMVYILSEMVLLFGYAWLVLNQHSQPVDFMNFLRDIKRSG